MSPAIFGIGTVEARRSWMVGPTVAGRVLSVQVDVGDTVKAGQLLAEMDPVDLDQRLARSTPRWPARRQRTGGGASAGGRRHGAARAGSRQRQAQPGPGARKTSSAPARWRRACRNRPRPTPRVQAAQANLGGSGQDMPACTPSAPRWRSSAATCACWRPADGVVTSRDAEAGSTVVAGQPVLRLIDPASLWVKLRVDQGRSAGLAPGLKAAHRAALAPGQATCRPGGAGGAAGRQRDRRAHRAWWRLTHCRAGPRVGGRNGRSHAATARHCARACCCPTPACSGTRDRPACGG